MNLVMDRFQGITGAATIAGRMVAKRRPGTDTCQKVVGA